jgi:hypothetical protein
MKTRFKSLLFEFNLYRYTVAQPRARRGCAVPGGGQPRRGGAVRGRGRARLAVLFRRRSVSDADADADADFDAHDVVWANSDGEGDEVGLYKLNAVHPYLESVRLQPSNLSSDD